MALSGFQYSRAVTLDDMGRVVLPSPVLNIESARGIPVVFAWLSTMNTDVLMVDTIWGNQGGWQFGDDWRASRVGYRLDCCSCSCGHILYCCTTIMDPPGSDDSDGTTATRMELSLGQVERSNYITMAASQVVWWCGEWGVPGVWLPITTAGTATGSGQECQE